MMQPAGVLCDSKLTVSVQAPSLNGHSQWSVNTELVVSDWLVADWRVHLAAADVTNS